MAVNFEGILAALSSKTPGTEGTGGPGEGLPGKDLKYDPVYDKIKESRFEEEAYLSQGIWERDLKRADWAETEKLCAEALANDTSDLQIVCWLCEACFHLYSWGGLESAFCFFRQFLMEYWDFSYPLISEEYFDVGIEHRVRIFEWFLEKMHDCVLFMPVNSQDSQPDIEINFATLASAIKLDSVARRSGSGEAKLQELEGAGEITLRRFRKLLKQVPVQHVQFIGNTVKSVIENVAICEEFLAQKCGGQAPSFAKLKELLANITKTCDSVVAGPPQETIAIVAQRMGDITPEEGSADWGRADLAESEEGEPKKDAKNAGQNASQNASEGQNAEEIAIAGKADAYKALNDLADYLIEIDPQNPGPYLVKLVSTWHEKPFPELLDDIASGETHGHRVLKMIAELVKRN